MYQVIHLILTIQTCKKSLCFIGICLNLFVMALGQIAATFCDKYLTSKRVNSCQGLPDGLSFEKLSFDIPISSLEVVGSSVLTVRDTRLHLEEKYLI